MNTTNIGEKVTMRSLADKAGYSPWHSARMFKEITGETPFDYIRKLRLTYAAKRLMDRDVRIVDVAFDFVFGSHESFTRAFSRHFGMTPRTFKKDKPDLNLLLPGYIHDHYYRKIQKGEEGMPSKKVKKNILSLCLTLRLSETSTLRHFDSSTLRLSELSYASKIVSRMTSSAVVNPSCMKPMPASRRGTMP